MLKVSRPIADLKWQYFHNGLLDILLCFSVLTDNFVLMMDINANVQYYTCLLRTFFVFKQPVAHLTQFVFTIHPFLIIH